MKTPDDLDDYIRVSNPGVWLLLISVILLLAGVCVWGVFGRIDSTVPSAVTVKNGCAVCYVAEQNMEEVKIGQTVKFAEQEAVITQIGEKEANGYACTLTTVTGLPDGAYEGKVVINTYRPLSFILN